MFQRFKGVGKRRRASARRSVRTLLSIEQFAAALERESARVDRAGRNDMTLVLFRVKRQRGRTLSSIRLARTILKRIRVTDDVGWFDKTHLGLLLPDTEPSAAWQLVSNIQEAIGRHGPKPLCTLYTYPVQEQAEIAEAPKLKVAS